LYVQNFGKNESIGVFLESMAYMKFLNNKLFFLGREVTQEEGEIFPKVSPKVSVKFRENCFGSNFCFNSKQKNS